MSNIKTIEGDLVARGARFGIVAARFNRFITDSLLEGAMDSLRRHGCEETVEVVWVPGAYEIPLTLKTMAESGNFDALIALGAVIRGSTPHFDFIASACSNGVAQVGLEHKLPVIFGVLTVDTIEQAIERAGTKAGNKGADAAASAVEMVNVLKKLKA